MSKEEENKDNNIIRDIAKRAFVHGRNYVDDNSKDGDISTVLFPDNKLPFAEWFAKHYEKYLHPKTLYAIKDTESGNYIYYDNEYVKNGVRGYIGESISIVGADLTPRESAVKATLRWIKQGIYTVNRCIDTANLKIVTLTITEGE